MEYLLPCQLGFVYFYFVFLFPDIFQKVILQNIARIFLAKFLSEKASLGKHSYLKYALDLVILENSCPYVDVGSCFQCSPAMPYLP